MKPLFAALSVLTAWMFALEFAFAQVPEIVERNFNRAIETGDITGAQVAAAKNGEVLFAKGFGSVEPGVKVSVDNDTLFLIGSCSKPFASICVISLIDDPDCALALDTAIDRYLPAFAQMDLSDGGKASRAPSVEELLNHRAGIFSQKVKITPAQSKWLYTFDHTLEKAVDEISRFPLLADPGSRFAYSGAGYCVLGRVAELAAGKEFESILQESVCKPVGLKRTTYFPEKVLPGATIAVGIQQQEAPHQLGDRHLFPLIGGSLYSTATEMARFGDAIGQEWQNADEGPFGVGQETIRQLAKIDPAVSSYGLGWSVVRKNGKPAVLTHSGSLQSYRAWIAVDLETGASMAACWTLTGSRRQLPVAKWLQESLSSL